MGSGHPAQCHQPLYQLQRPAEPWAQISTGSSLLGREYPERDSGHGLNQSACLDSQAGAETGSQDAVSGPELVPQSYCWPLSPPVGAQMRSRAHHGSPGIPRLQGLCPGTPGQDQIPCWTTVRLEQRHATAPTPADGAVPRGLAWKRRGKRRQTRWELCAWRKQLSGWGGQGARTRRAEPAHAPPRVRSGGFLRQQTPAQTRKAGPETSD